MNNMWIILIIIIIVISILFIYYIITKNKEGPFVYVKTENGDKYIKYNYDDNYTFSFTTDKNKATKFRYHDNDRDYLRNKKYESHYICYWNEDYKFQYLTDSKDNVLLELENKNGKFKIIVRTLTFCRASTHYLTYNDKKLEWNPGSKLYSSKKFTIVC